MTETNATSPLGAVVKEGTGYRLEFVRTFPDPIDRVWEALTESAELEGWFGTWSGDPTTGVIQLHFREAPEPGPVEIKECDPPQRLAIILPSPDGPWPLTLDLEATETGTELRFVHQLTEPFDATAVGPGWQYYLDRLGAHIAGTEIPDNWDAYTGLSANYGLPE